MCRHYLSRDEIIPAIMYRMQQMNGDMKNIIINHIHLFSSTYPQWGQVVASAFISSLQDLHCLVSMMSSYHKKAGKYANR